MNKTLGAGPRIRQWRKVKKLKGYQLAKLIKISQGSLSDIENGKSDPSAKTIKNFINFTDINIIWMLTGQEGEVTHGSMALEIPEVFVSSSWENFIIRRKD